MERRDKINYYLDIAEVVSQRSTCLRRHYGAVIVKNDEVIATGYTGAPRGRKNCSDLGFCMREKLKVPRGERYELCRSVHAEQNAIISCAMCKRVIINAGIEKVYIRDDKDNFRIVNVNDWIENDDSLSGMFGY